MYWKVEGSGSSETAGSQICQCQCRSLLSKKKTLYSSVRIGFNLLIALHGGLQKKAFTKFSHGGVVEPQQGECRARLSLRYSVCDLAINIAIGHKQRRRTWRLAGSRAGRSDGKSQEASVSTAERLNQSGRRVVARGQAAKEESKGL